MLKPVTRSTSKTRFRRHGGSVPDQGHQAGTRCCDQSAPAAVAWDPERLARFEREAKVLASLNHPNIAQIYGVEDRAIVMELVDGPTLADRPKAGTLPLE